MQNHSEQNKRLEKANLKKTPVRLKILSQFMSVDHAQSFFDLKEILSKKIDKSTLYRTLKSFEDAGIVHRITDATGVAKYAYNYEEHNLEHAHFICENCDTVYCVDTQKFSDVELPKGFQINTMQTTLMGTCANC